MSISVTKAFTRLIIVLMVFECFTIAFATPCSGDRDDPSIREKTLSALLFAVLMSETEEEKSEGDHKAVAVKLADFTKIASFLSKIHTPHQRFIVYGHRDDHHLSWFKLFRVFRI